MRLLNAKTFKLESFHDSLKVRYAILSHTWEEEGEVTFDDMNDLLNDTIQYGVVLGDIKDLAAASTKQGFAKITAACQKTIEYGLEYIWIDTCCINKSSSAELAEAINSMFQWYKDAEICFAFISDLSNTDLDARLCRWFTRGWTLQELIAPSNLVFFNKDWKYIGTKVKLRHVVEVITGIDRRILVGSEPLSSVSLAKRMSWAATRETTRVEDKAYCLLGIFNVNMTMIYGEGPKAFIRLQEEILRKTTDLSLFAWKALDNLDSRSSGYRGILAQSPAEFLTCGDIILNDDQFRFRGEISLTNRGVKIETPVARSAGIREYVMDLHCYRAGSGPRERLAITLVRPLDVYYRHPHPTLTPIESRRVPQGLPRTLFLAPTGGEESRVAPNNARGIHFRFGSSVKSARVSSRFRAAPAAFWDDDDLFFSVETFSEFACFVQFSVRSRVVQQQPPSPLALPPPAQCSTPTTTSQANTPGLLPPTPVPVPAAEMAVPTVTKEETSFILVCDLAPSGSTSELLLSLYVPRSLERTGVYEVDGFIDPFSNIDEYGPLGDKFSIGLLRAASKRHPADNNRGINRGPFARMQVFHSDPRHDFVVAARVDARTYVPSFVVDVNVMAPPNDRLLGGLPTEPFAPLL
ncbi:heterokaryon incompatibility protein-domain-containing protein [Apodospora peruviana]|uniref:Heterokaryon incompatibility protein-domain-containing protein n=1 Tax=Apodospora peruviana TaxID=516989 RepID=A0AAE0M2N6_9PEZI|nr:heterokaryon incompatibility protein-domain-containing protein [Apodospora peruviana]